MVEAGCDVVHICTPPNSHVPLAIEAMERGCHVLIETPLAEDEEEGRKVLAVADRTGKVASVNHCYLWDPHVARALEAVRAGKIGKVVSVDVLQDAGYPPYAGGPLPPHYRTAGYPFRALGVHFFYLLEAFLGPIQDVRASWRSLGGDLNLAFDEWRAMVTCESGPGQFQISYNGRPMQSQLVVHGTKTILRVDLFSMFQAKRAATPLPKAAERIVNAMTDSIQPLIEVPLNVVKFARKQSQANRGLRNHLAAFYAALAAGGPPPIAVSDAIRIIKWTEHVGRAADADYQARRARLVLSDQVPYLVTGASGHLGRATVNRLLADGKRVRIFQRQLPSPESIPDGVEVAIGNLGDPNAVDRAVRGVHTVIHVGAAMKGGPIDHQCGTVLGTQNMLEAAKRHGVKRFVHISSLSVVDWAGSSEGQPVSEETPLEPRAEERGTYTQAKLAAERLVVASANAGEIPAVILRPGQIFGHGLPVVTGAVARRVAGHYLVLGDGEVTLPLVHIEDVVDAIVLAAKSDLSRGEILQIVDTDLLTQNQVLSTAGDGSRVIRVPRPIVFALARLSELVFGALGRKSPVALYRLKSALALLKFESDRASRLLGWKPCVGVRRGILQSQPRA
jgi:nucleoside-diphosphate-sugar epimerase/predicted dehydrogenase